MATEHAQGTFDEGELREACKAIIDGPGRHGAAITGSELYLAHCALILLDRAKVHDATLRSILACYRKHYQGCASYVRLPCDCPYGLSAAALGLPVEPPP